MPKCAKCTTVQAKLNKMKLCKKCHQNDNDQNKGNNLKENKLKESIHTQLPSDRTIIALIKEIWNERKRGTPR